jgi:Rad3-related DNA helicase
MTRNDYGDITSILQTIINPLTSKLQTLEDKVDKLNTDRVTRTDFENLRKEISGSYVPRDAYEPRHLALVERQTTLESSIREVRKDHVDDIKNIRDEIGQDLQHVHDRLESGKQQLEERIAKQSEMQLSTKDRNWMRLSQWIGVLAIILSVLDWIFQHVKLQ